MGIRKQYGLILAVSCFMGMALVGSSPTFAQVGGGVGGGIQGGGGGAGGGGIGGAGGGAGGAGGAGGGAGGAAGGRGGAAGIMVDAEGVVRAVFVPDNSGKLSKKRLEAEAKKALPADMTSYSSLRHVSLVQLEAACEKFAEKKENVTPDMQFLAGLQRIDYIFVLPDTKDIVIAGPAEGFALDATGRAVGITTGRPPLRLDDLMAALRTLQRGGTLGCSIDPKPENMAKFNDYVRKNSFPTTVEGAQARYPEMADALGMQKVRIWGVPAESHFAKTLVEADYRMKLISLGLEVTEVKSLRSHLSMIPPGGNSSQRWWFTPLYDAFVKSEDGLAFQLAGQRTQLVAQEEMVDAGGGRMDAPTTRGTTHKWAKHFTDKFPELAKVSPVFAELQNLVDLAVVAALLKKEQLSQKVGWTMSLFLDEQRATLAKWNVPRQVKTVANSKVTNGTRVIGITGGGVTIDPLRTATLLHYREDSEGKLKAAREEALRQEAPAEHSWWWD